MRLNHVKIALIRNIRMSLMWWLGNIYKTYMSSNLYRFIEKLVESMVGLHSTIQPLKVFHMGGDEVAEKAWEDSTKCKELLPGSSHRYRIR